MPSYLHPGVYMEEVPSGARPIESAGTSTAAILGLATKGPDDEPILIFSWKEYVEIFGGIQDFGATPDYMGHTVQAFFENGGGKAYICRVSDGHQAAKGTMFFPGDLTLSSPLPGIEFETKSAGKWGNDIIVSIEEIPQGSDPSKFTVRVLKQTATGRDLVEEFIERDYDPANLQVFADNLAAENSEYITITGVANIIPPTTTYPETGEEYKDEWVSDVVGSPFDFTSPAEFNIGLDGNPLKTYRFDLSTTSAASTLDAIAAEIQSIVRDSGDSETFTCQMHDDGDKLIFSSGSNISTSKVTIGVKLKNRLILPNNNLTGHSGLDSFQEAYKKKSISIASNGADGILSTNKSDYSAFFDQLKNFRDVNIILLPAHPYIGNSSTTIVDAAIGHATSMGNRMVIIDPPQGKLLKSSKDVAGIGVPTSEYSALYYPWIQVTNPNYHPEKNNTVPPLHYIAPSGFAAGLWARTDGLRGVWKAPAGLGANIFGALRTEYLVGSDQQDQLNPVGVNCIRKILSAPVIWGARTLATKAVPEKRYVPVQRTTLMIKESVYQGIQWAVFEPNDHNLWASLRLNIEAFMDGLHRAGAFQGEKASDAYFVRCGLGQTMTQGDIDAGRVIVEVGFAPLKPAEFVIVRLSQKTAQ